METRSFGGRALTRLGLGMAGLGRPAYHALDHGKDFPEGRSPELMRTRAHAVLDAAYEAGIRYVDVARSYGAAESFVRSWADARRLSPAALVVGSKWGYRYVGAWRLEAERHEVKDHSLAAFLAQSAESREALGPFLAIYHVHSVTIDSPVLGDGALLDALARLRDEGVRVGLTVSSPAQADVVERALEIARGGAPLFTSVQATWNLLERAAEPALRAAHDAGRLVIVKEALANGRLTSRGDAGASGPLADAARSAATTPDALALAAVLARPWADVVLLGATTVAQLRSNLAALRLSPPPGTLEPLDALIEAPADYWRRRATFPWT